MTTRLLSFFDIQERILKNHLLICLIYAIFLPDTIIDVGSTIHKVHPKTIELLKEQGRKPKATLHNLVLRFEKPCTLHVGLQFEDHEPNWESFTYDTSVSSLKSIVSELFAHFMLHPAKTDRCFKTQAIPKGFEDYLEKYGCSRIWKLGVARHNLLRLENNYPSSSKLDSIEVDKYYQALENVLKKYQVFAKVLLRILKNPYYSLSNSAEKFHITYLYDSDSIHIEYENRTEDKVIIEVVKITDFNPKNIDNIAVPLIHLAFMK